VWKVPLTGGDQILLTEKETEGYWGPGIFFTTGSHRAPWSLPQRAAYWDESSSGQPMLIDLLHIAPVPLTLKEPLNKYIRKAQDGQKETYKINHLDFNYLPTLVHLGPASFFVCLFCFLSQLLLSLTLLPLEPGTSLFCFPDANEC